MQSHAAGQHPEDVDRSGPDLNAAANMLPKGSDKTTDALDSTLEKLPPRYENSIFTAPRLALLMQRKELIVIRYNLEVYIQWITYFSGGETG